GHRGTGGGWAGCASAAASTNRPHEAIDLDLIRALRVTTRPGVLTTVLDTRPAEPPATKYLQPRCGRQTVLRNYQESKSTRADSRVPLPNSRRSVVAVVRLKPDTTGASRTKPFAASAFRGHRAHTHSSGTVLDAVASCIYSPGRSLMFESVRQDLWHGARMGANAAMFSIADGLVFRPLPVPSPNGVLSIAATTPTGEVRIGGISYPDY